jgi:hypothetical protein
MFVHLIAFFNGSIVKVLSFIILKPISVILHFGNFILSINVHECNINNASVKSSMEK